MEPKRPRLTSGTEMSELNAAYEVVMNDPHDGQSWSIENEDMSDDMLSARYDTIMQGAGISDLQVSPVIVNPY